MHAVNTPRLLAWMAGSLDPGAAFEVDAAVRADSALRASMMRLSAVLAAPVVERDPWCVPPPSFVASQLGSAQVSRPVMHGADTLAPGGRFRMRLHPVDQADHQLLLVMYRASNAWIIVSPTSSSTVVMLSDVPVVDGALQLDLAAGPEVGRQRWVVVAVPESMPVEWGASDPWVHVKRALRAGELSSSSVDVVVA